MEAYRKLCEMRILDFDPDHALPVTEEMIGLTKISNSNSNKSGPSVELKKQLALKEQDLLYAKQRAERVMKENEDLRVENDKLLAQISQL